MGKNAPDLMRPETFAMGVDLDKRRLAWRIRHPATPQHPLREIHTLLTQYWGLPKAMLTSRHTLMKSIIQRGTAYVATKGKASFSSEKALTVRALVWQAATRLEVETKRAATLEREVNAAQAGSAKIHQGLRYERAAKPGGVALVGDELYAQAQSGALGQIELTGNDVNDLYALRKLLKTLTPRDVVDKGLKVLEYADEESRNQYAVKIEKDKFTWDELGTVIDTTTCSKGDPPGTGLYSADLEGDFYCRVYDQTPENRGWFAHSSFLAGANAMCAGTLKIFYGRLIEISNLSGHYRPRMEDLVNACQAILDAGYDPRSDGYALFVDFAFECPASQRPKATNYYRFPLKKFAQTQGRITKAEDFEVSKPDASGILKYTNKAAAKSRGAVETNV